MMVRKLITQYLWDTIIYPQLEKDLSLSSFRSALVNNNVFAALAVKWNLHKYIKYNSTQLYSAVNKFVQHQKSRNDRIQVEQVCVIDAARSLDFLG